MKRIIILFLQALISACPMMAQQQKTNDKEAINLYNQGVKYYTGKNGTDKNDVKAADFFKKSAELGYAQAQYWLGRCYYYGVGVTKNYQEAISWFSKAAEQNNNDAQYQLAYMLYNGYGFEKDMKKSVEWFKKSAEHGNTKAQYLYGAYALSGYYTKKDTLEALFWLHEAAEENINLKHKGQGNKDALALLTELAEQPSGHSYQALFYLGDIYFYKEDFIKAEDYYKKAIAKGSIEAEAGLGLLYYETDAKYEEIVFAGNDSAQMKIEYLDKIAAFKLTSKRNSNDNAAYWLTKALEHGADDWIFGGNHMLYWYLYATFYNGRGVDKNWYTAANYLRTFIEKGGMFDGEEIPRLADMLYFGRHCLKADYEKAFRLYNEYGDKYEHSSWSLTGIGRCHYFGKGTAQNYQKAYNAFMKAATDNYPDAEAMRFLSKCYRFGRGVKQDIKEADKWHKKALENNDSETKKLQELLE